MRHGLLNFVKKFYEIDNALDFAATKQASLLPNTLENP